MTDKMAEENKGGERPAIPPTGRRRKKRFFIPALILLILAAAIFLYWYYFLRGYVATDDAVIDSDPVTISSKILGRIVALNTDEGDSVEAGELLVQIDDSDLKAREAQAVADLDYIQQNVRVASIALGRARDDFGRDSVQFSDHAITREQFDHTRSTLEMAQAQQAVALSHVKASQAQLAVIETELANTRISASSSGVVARKWVVPGDIVQPGQPIFTMFDLNDVWVTANFEETKLASIHPGDSVEISVDAIPGRKFTGMVELIGAAAASQFALIPPNNASGNFTKITQRIPVKILFSDLDGNGTLGQVPLLPGMSVEVKIRLTEK
jgi:membrane fusion protein (multidrug efflux system)